MAAPPGAWIGGGQGIQAFVTEPMRNVRVMMAAAMLLLAVFSGCDRGGGAQDGPRSAGAPEAKGDSGAPAGQLPPGVTAQQGGQGRRLYREACVMCHGEGARGTQLGPSLVDAEWSRGAGTFEEVIQVVTEGAPGTEQFGVPMPPRGNGTFTDEQIRAVAAYTFSLARPAGP